MPGKRTWRDRAIRLWFVASPRHVECGGLLVLSEAEGPPLYAVPACRDVLQSAAPRARSGKMPAETITSLYCLRGLGEACFAQKQRRQAAALHMGCAGNEPEIMVTSRPRFVGARYIVPDERAWRLFAIPRDIPARHAVLMVAPRNAAPGARPELLAGVPLRKEHMLRESPARLRERPNPCCAGFRLPARPVLTV